MECSNSGGAEDKNRGTDSKNVSRTGSNGGCMVRALLDHTQCKKLWRERIVQFPLG